MTIATIDHVTTGVDRLTYKLTQDNIIKLLTIFLNGVQDLEDSFIELAEQKDIDTAAGEWLDYIGKIVGEDRNSLSDDDYRVALRLRIGINNSDGTPEIMRELINSYTDSESIKLTEHGIAFGTISLNGQDNIGGSLYEFIDEIKPAATRWLIHSDYYDSAFLTAYEESTYISEAFTVTDDGVDFESFQTTEDGTNYSSWYYVEQDVNIYTPSLSDGKNSFYYEYDLDFQTTSDGVTFEDFEVTDDGATYTTLGVTIPYDEDYIPEGELPLHWEVWEDSENIE